MMLLLPHKQNASVVTMTDSAINPCLDMKAIICSPLPLEGGPTLELLSNVEIVPSKY